MRSDKITLKNVTPGKPTFLIHCQKGQTPPGCTPEEKKLHLQPLITLPSLKLTEILQQYNGSMKFLQRMSHRLAKNSTFNYCSASRT